MAYPPDTARTQPLTVNSTLTDLGAWDVRDTATLSIVVENEGLEAVTPVVKARVDVANAWGPSPLAFSTESGDGVIAAGTTGRLDIDPGANLEVYLGATAETLSSSVRITARARRRR